MQVHKYERIFFDRFIGDKFQKVPSSYRVAQPDYIDV